jgi:hypothetical protein
MTDSADAGVRRGEDAPIFLGLSPTALVIWTIVISAVCRVLMGLALGYGNGEGYYLETARRLALSYFDQPPLFLWIAHFTIALVGTGSTLLPRLPFIAIFAGTTWLMYRLGARLFGEAAGAWGAVLLNLSELFTISVGSWVQPDAVLFFFLAASALAVADLCFGEPKHPLRQWALAGAWFGLAMLSKYHAALILAGLLIFVATTPGHRKWFFKPGVVLAGVIAAAIFAPVVIWNAQNHWVSFGFQGSRIARGVGLHFDWLARSFLGQALLIGFLIWPMLILVFVKALRAGPRDAKSWFLCCLASVPIIVFTAAALWAPLGYHFHWQAPGYVFLFPLLGKYTAERLEQGRRSTRYWLIACASTLVLVLGLVATQAQTGWMHGLLASRSHPRPYDSNNPTRELLEWRPLRAALDQRGLLNQDRLFVVTTKWFQAGKADVVVGDKLPVVCLCGDARNIAFVWNDRAFKDWDALIVVPSNNSGDPAAGYKPYFRSIEPLTDVDIPLGGQTALTLHVYRAHDYYRPYPMLYGLSGGSGAARPATSDEP